ncbi:MAG: CDP-diacylglycerol--glycerol-3-phosphate 3-phosphatidyltransferase [Opitutaceae bacterium]|nr:CDP-diacylglycerol--glycerol-3-phosphate 3-phosphatidyltransferase [Opitutaceae bacterium]|tara:strand:+ start:7169 stop:7780 length:612 start_codon:yes stop_codon:yes gene_type:complete
MNLPNMLTLSRVPFLFLIAILVYWEFRFADSIAFVVFVVAGLTDWLDGKIARERGIISEFGQLMDALTDKVLTVGLFILLMAQGLLLDWMVFMVLLILSREFLITGLRLVAAAKNTILAAEKAGKIKTVFQIVSIGALIIARALEVDWNPYLQLDMGSFIQYVDYFGWILFTVATLMTVYSGTGYLVKYWGLFFGTTGPADKE